MSQLKFKVGDYITVADPNDPSHFKRFHKVVGILPGWDEYGEIPYSIKSLQTGEIHTPHGFQMYISDIRASKFSYEQTIVVDDSYSNLLWFEITYRLLTKKEELIYINE